MALQYSSAAQNAQQSAIVATIGAAPLFEAFTGAQPANCAAADTGTKLASFALPAVWMQAVGSTIMARLGDWVGTVSTTGTAAHFRLKDSTGATTHIQGSITRTGGGGDIVFDNPYLTDGHTITVGVFKFTGASLSTILGSCTFAGSAAVAGPLNTIMTDALNEIEGSMDDLKDEISGAIVELEGML